MNALKATHRSALAQLDVLNAQAEAAGICGGVVDPVFATKIANVSWQSG
jgi:hypothetical protein